MMAAAMSNGSTRPSKIFEKHTAGRGIEVRPTTAFRHEREPRISA